VITRVSSIAFNTFREAVRDRVLYNLIVFAVLIVGSALLLGQISIDVERLFLINMGLTAISLFGVVIAIFIGIGLVSKEIEKRTLYAILSRPVRRWEFILGKYFGLVGTLVVNAALMTAGFFAALLYLSKVSYPPYPFQSSDAYILVALYFILLQFVLITSLSLLFSTFSSPLLSAVISFALFIVGTFAEDIRAAAIMAGGSMGLLLRVVAHLVPNLGSLNVVSSVAHGEAVSGALTLHNSLYVALYSAAVIFAAILIFERRNFK
jgi:ABC-type transport system involved in multi-copper enzyme maturation permease subunit